MMRNVAERRAERIQTLAQKAGEQMGAEAAEFLKRFNERVAARDLLPREEPALVGSALSAWLLLGARKPGVPRIWVFSPNQKADG